jgi:hypothetical protein
VTIRTGFRLSQNWNNVVAPMAHEARAIYRNICSMMTADKSASSGIPLSQFYQRAVNSLGLAAPAQKRQAPQPA